MKFDFITTTIAIYQSTKSNKFFLSYIRNFNKYFSNAHINILPTIFHANSFFGSTKKHKLNWSVKVNYISLKYYKSNKKALAVKSAYTRKKNFVEFSIFHFSDWKIWTALSTLFSCSPRKIYTEIFLMPNVEKWCKQFLWLKNLFWWDWQLFEEF